MAFTKLGRDSGPKRYYIKGVNTRGVTHWAPLLPAPPAQQPTEEKP